MTDTTPPIPPRTAKPWWCSWIGVAALAAAVLVARLAFHLLASRFGLSADEAQYWDWSRRLDWSYYSKGPGVAWLIRAATEALGDAAWAVRTPAALAAAATTIAVAALARRIARRPGVAGFHAAALWSALPVSIVAGLLMTIDMPYLCCWAAASWALVALLGGAARRGPVAAPAMLFAAAVGVGFLFKYTILLLLPGALLALWRCRSLLPRPGLRAGALAAAAALLALALMSPVAIWNAEHGWPTAKHLLGHLGAPGGDLPAGSAAQRRPWSAWWPAEFALTQIAVVGPAWGLIALGVARRTRVRDATRRALHDTCILLAAPILVFYTLVSFVTDAEANWPIAAYLTLVAPAASWLAPELRRYRIKRTRWRALPEPRPRRGALRRAPETLAQVSWHWTLGGAAAVAVVIAAFPLLDRVPVLTRVVPLHRADGGAALADAALDALGHAPQAGARLTDPPFVIADRYTRASLLAHALHLRLRDAAPTVTSAASALGDRESSYDYFPDTALDRPDVLGADVLLVGAHLDKWARGIDARRIVPAPIHQAPGEPPPAVRVFFAIGYRGPRTP